MAAAKRRAEEKPAERVRRLLLERTADAVAVLVTVMQDESQKSEVRLKAAESILDRAAGKHAPPEEGGEAPGVIRFEGALEEWSR